MKRIVHAESWIARIMVSAASACHITGSIETSPHVSGKMASPYLTKSRKGKDMHYSIGAIIKRNNKYLIVDRKKQPLGFAGIAGHVEKNENPPSALLREVVEESGLLVKNYKLVFEEEIEENTCSRGITVHYWWIYECEADGEPKLKPDEANSMGWYSAEEIKNLKLEPVWEYFFKKLGIID